MRTLVSGLQGWVRMEKTQREELRTVDTALTVVFTLFLAATWALLHQ